MIVDVLRRSALLYQKLAENKEEIRMVFRGQGISPMYEFQTLIVINSWEKVLFSFILVYLRSGLYS